MGNKLEDLGWSVSVNEPYADPRSGDTRELDISAFTTLAAGPHKLDVVFPTILAECVNNPQPVAFITSPPRWPDLHVKAFRYVGEPTALFSTEREGELVSLEAFSELSAVHHYCRGEFASQYCSFEQKGRGAERGEWYATHSSEHHGVFTSLMDALDDYEAKQERLLPRRRLPGVWLTLLYPVLVLQGAIYAAKALKRSVAIRSVDHIQYRRTVVVAGERRTYHIDVTTERYLPKLAMQIRSEASHIAERLKQNAELVQRSSAEMRQREGRA